MVSRYQALFIEDVDIKVHKLAVQMENESQT
jgi:hypothetical protein